MRIAVAADEDTGVARDVLDQLRARGHHPRSAWRAGPGERTERSWAAEAALCGDAQTAAGVRRWTTRTSWALSLRTWMKSAPGDLIN